jgi:TRAP-type mannitol/chloroaromatic compound transport system permease large subunit
MSNLEIGLASFPALLILIFIRVPIGLAMFLVGLVGLYFTTGSFNLPLARLKSETFSTFSSYSLSIVPMFLLMGHFATLGGMSSALFKAAESFLGHRKGGIAMAAIGACAGFGSICGSSPRRLPWGVSLCLNCANMDILAVFPLPLWQPVAR